MGSKAIVIKNRTNHWKVQIIEQQNPYSLCKVDTIWKIDKDALKRVQYFLLNFYIFFMGGGDSIHELWILKKYPPHGDRGDSFYE